jgi:hypothetical protein
MDLTIIGLAVDLVGPGYTIDKDFVAFPPPPDSLLDTAATPRLNLYAYDGRKASVRKPLGLVATANMGTSLLYGDGNSYGMGMGYRLSAPLVLMGYCGDDVLQDHVPTGSLISMDASITGFALEARYHIALEAPGYLARSIYATGGLEYLFIGVDSLDLASDTNRQRVPGFSDRIPAVSLGAGMAFQGFFVEVRQHWSLERLHIREEMLEPLSYFTIRWGVNVEI